MEDINIPSPSAILDVQRPYASAAGHSNPSVSPKNSTAGQRGAAKDRSKPKQTKSRNGTVSLLFYYFSTSFSAMGMDGDRCVKIRAQEA